MSTSDETTDRRVEVSITEHGQTVAGSFATVADAIAFLEVGILTSPVDVGCPFCDAHAGRSCLTTNYGRYESVEYAGYPWSAYYHAQRRRAYQSHHNRARPA
jgi:hypothetical protein